VKRRDPADGLICSRLIYDPSDWKIEEGEAITRLKADELERLIAAGTIREVDRERVRFIVRKIVHPPEGFDDPFSENGVRGPRSDHARSM
jgi:hypothetical protein